MRWGRGWDGRVGGRTSQSAAVLYRHELNTREAKVHDVLGAVARTRGTQLMN